MSSFFVGNKVKPSFLVEITPRKKEVLIYKPDKFSKNEEFFEKYSLGKLLVSSKYSEIIFLQKPVAYKNHMFVPEIILKINNKYISVSKTIKEKK
jgi:hypothetical protein